MGLVIIYLYNSTVTDFTYNGQPLNKAYEVVVDRTINDSFFVTFNHPLDDKGIYKTIEKDKIVKVHTPEGMQPFRVMDRVKYMDHVSIEAWPLFYADMRNKLVKPLMIRGVSGQAALNTFVNNLLIDTPFTFTSNITDAHDYHTQDTEERENNPNQLYNALDVFKDIVTRWKGELVINGYDIRLLNRLGTNTGALLYEKKNISDFTDEESIQDVTTRLYGKSEWTERPKGSDEEIKHSVSAKVESPLINAYSGIVFEKQYTNNDIRTEKEMKDWLNLKFTTDNIDKPSRNIKVNTNIVDDTVINLGDSLVLKYVKHDVDMEIRMVGYTYDGYANRYITVQLGDAKQSYVGNVQNTVKEIETNVNNSVKQTVNQILNANGERIFYSVNEPVGNFKNGDVWFDQQGGMYFWDEEKGMWVDHPYNQNMNIVAEKVEEAIEEVEKAVQSANDADVRANEAIEKAGANANLLTTHQNTLDAIKNTTIPNVNKVASDAMAEAKSALSSASSAMDEAKKADGKIADYVTRNGLVNGTTVDTKINDATGEISKKITTVESKIPTEIGGRNLIPQSDFNAGIATGGHSAKDGFQFNGVTYSNENGEFKVVFPTDGGSSIRFVFWSAGDKLDLQKGEKVTLSFKGRTDSDNNLCVRGGGTFVTPMIKEPMTSTDEIHTITFEAPQRLKNGAFVFWLENAGVVVFDWMKLELGSVRTDWSPAPEDNYTQEEFSIFESTYKEDVKGINSSLTDLSNKKLDGSTYTTFYNNEYKKTAQGVTDTYTKVNKIIDANGNSTDAFAKAVYDRNATRQSADFNEVTKDLVKTATYTAGINGINNSITTIRGNLDSLIVGGENLVLNSNFENDTENWTLYRGVLEKQRGVFTINGRSHNFIRLDASNLTSDSRVETDVTLDSETEYVISAYVHRRVYFILEEYDTDGNRTQRIEKSFYGNYSRENVVFTTKEKTSYVRVVFQSKPGDHGLVSLVKLEKGNIPTAWSKSPQEQLGKADFQIFKGEYESNDQAIKNRLTAIDSGKEGSVIYNANKALSTAQGNTSSITTLDTKVDNLKVGGENLLSTTADGYADGYIVGIGEDGLPPVFRAYDRHTISGYIDIGNKGLAEEFVFSKKTVGGDEYFRIVWLSEFGNVLRRDAVSDNVFVTKSPSLAVKVRFSFPTGSQAMMQKGNKPTEYAPSLQDQLGKAEFTVFKNDYKDTAKSVERRLTAIDSSAEGSVVTRLNKTEKTASGNSTLISTINKNYVKQSNIDASILADKKIKDTRNTNQLPSWYFSKYPTQEVREFKQVSTMGIGSGTYGILTTNVPWSSSSGGTVKQTFETNTETHVRQSNSAGTAWGAWAKQIDTSDTTYQKVTQTSSLYERVLGSTENNLNTNISRIVQTSEIIQQTVTSAMNVENRNLLITKNATKDSWLTGSEGYPKPSSQPNSGTSTSPDLIEVKNGDKFTLSKNETTLYFRVSFLNSSKKYIGRYVQNAKLGTITPPSGTAYIWVSYPTNADAKVEKGTIATGYSPAPEDTATQSHITQLSNNINLKVSKNDISNQININTQGVVIQGGKISLSGQTTVDGEFWAKQVNAIKVNASNITTGTLNASKVKVINLDANNITANKTSFVQSAWNAINSQVSIDGSGIKTNNTNGDFSRIISGELRSYNKDSSSTAILGSGRSQYFDKAGSQFILGNTLHGNEWQNDGTLQVTHNRRFAIGRYADYAVNNGLFHPYIALEYPPDKTGEEPQGIVRFYKAIYLQKDIYAGNNAVSGLSKITFHNGGNIESQPKTSNMLIGASNKLVVYASGKNAFEIDSGYMYLKRNLSMEGNKITNQSDRRLKTNIVDTPVDSLSAISNWSFKAFDRVNNGTHDDVGLIAQDTSEIVVYDEENDTYYIDSSKQIMMNSHGIQQLNTKVDDKVEQLEAKIASLQEELALLKGD